VVLFFDCGHVTLLSGKRYDRAALNIGGWTKKCSLMSNPWTDLPLETAKRFSIKKAVAVKTGLSACGDSEGVHKSKEWSHDRSSIPRFRLWLVGKTLELRVQFVVPEDLVLISPLDETRV
jgi:hypothetical protein